MQHGLPQRVKTRRASERRYGCFRQLRTLVGQSGSGQAAPLWATTAGKLMAQAVTPALDSHRAATRAQAVVMALTELGTGLGEAGEVVTSPATHCEHCDHHQGDPSPQGTRVWKSGARTPPALVKPAEEVSGCTRRSGVAPFLAIASPKRDPPQQPVSAGAFCSKPKTFVQILLDCFC
jgi:hypothetical protein